jgi:hypothetical protein
VLCHARGFIVGSHSPGEIGPQFEAAFVGAAHTDEDIAKTIEAAKSA